MADKLGKIKKILKDDAVFYIQNNTMCFLPGNRIPLKTAGTGLIAKIQEKIKRNGWLYYFLLKIFSPFLRANKFRIRFKAIINKYNDEELILNLGSGPRCLFYRKDIINMDLYAFDEVDIVGDAIDIPFKKNSLDLIVNIAMLEHVDTPEKVVSEMYRILKDNGEIICFLPFIVPFHAAPTDYYRWTIPGIKKLFAQFDILEVGIGVGPVSGMLWTVQEGLAIIFSFGSKTLHDAIIMVLMILTAPIKLLDILVERFPHAEKIAGGFYIIARK
jgi:SAM-dependent methyltransferase